MPFQGLKIQDYRNFQQIDLEFHPTLNVIEGDNAQGKTNLLEALFYLSYGRSFRTTQRESLIRKGQSFARLRASLEHEGLQSELLGEIRPEGRSIQFNQKQLRNWDKLHGFLRVLTFTPDSTTLFRSSPGQRRQYFDQAVASHYPNYAPGLRRYQRVLRQRNRLLENRAGREQLLGYDEQWAELALQILVARREYLSELLPRWTERLGALTQSMGKLKAHWLGPFEGWEEGSREDLIRGLNENFQQDLRRGHTTVGPHREDLWVGFELDAVRELASQGQQRMLTIALKLAEADLFLHKTGHRPLFLLDDIGSELDPGHLHRLLAALGELQFQTLLSTAHPGEYSGLAAKTFRVSQGSIGEAC